LRTQVGRRLRQLEELADISFIAGMLLMVMICLFVTYAVS